MNKLYKIKGVPSNNSLAMSIAEHGNILFLVPLPNEKELKEAISRARLEGKPVACQITFFLRDDLEEVIAVSCDEGLEQFGIEFKENNKPENNV